MSDHTNSVLGKRAHNLLNDDLTNPSSTTSTEGSSPKTPKFWLPPVASLLSPPNPKLHFLPPLLMTDPIQKKEKPSPHQVFMPMIPYYFHHKDFGIESCMLQLEGQKKFSKYYYI